MSVGSERPGSRFSALARLYPRAFREYWGEEFTGAIRGCRDAPDLVREAVRLWAHPALWPADDAAQRRNRARTAGLALAVVSGWVMALLTEFDGVRSPAALLVLVVAAALLTPWRDLNRLVRRLIRPALAAATIVVLANGTSLDRHDQPAAALVVVAWWATLAWAGVTVVQGLGAPGARAPAGRLTGGLVAVAVGGAALAADALVHHRDGPGLAGGVAFAVLTVIALTTLTDLRLLPVR
jgi:hypothetical protein